MAYTVYPTGVSKAAWTVDIQMIQMLQFNTFCDKHLNLYLYLLVLWTERMHLYPCGPGRCPDRKCLLGALLSWTRCWSWWSASGGSCRVEHSSRSIQHFFQYWELWTSCSTSNICRSGAHSDWWVDLNTYLLLPSLSLLFIIIASILCDWMHLV